MALYGIRPISSSTFLAQSQVQCNPGQPSVASSVNKIFSAVGRKCSHASSYQQSRYVVAHMMLNILSQDITVSP